MFEVEKRAFIEKKDLNRLMKELDKKTKFVKTKKFHTLLYPKPHYLRIRWSDDKKSKNNISNITVKKGKYADGFREEYEMDILVKDIPNLVAIFQALGFDKCSYLKSEWYSYEYKGFKIDLTSHDYLGTLLEIEKLTSNKNEIQKISDEITEIMKELGLKELSTNKYQKMMNKMYKDSLKSIKSQKILKVIR
ncbi:MAG: class IV adenylate cyclase [Candidatus Woesearchaeota archaeon]|jgi:predicted adenylyl cyclase CyaB